MCSAHSHKLLDHLLVVAFKLSKSLQTIFMPIIACKIALPVSYCTFLHKPIIQFLLEGSLHKTISSLKRGKSNEWPIFLQKLKDGAIGYLIQTYFCVVYEYAGKADLNKSY